MGKTKLTFLFLIWSVGAFAKEQWICTEQSSQRDGNVIAACGIGSGQDENEARLSAFDNSKSEFKRVCDASDDCKGRAISAEPQRTTCEKNGTSFKCYRMITFTIGERIKDQDRAVSSGDAKESMQPFSYDEISSLPKVRKGMTKKELLQSIGAPRSVDQEMASFGGGVAFHYKGKMCVYESSLCHIYLKNDRVDKYYDIKPVYTEDLK